MTCQETLAFYGGVTLGGAKWTRASRAERVAEVLAAVGLAHTAHTLVRNATSPRGLRKRWRHVRTSVLVLCVLPTVVTTMGFFSFPKIDVCDGVKSASPRVVCWY
jgi:hypothetical protein